MGSFNPEVPGSPGLDMPPATPPQSAQTGHTGWVEGSQTGMGPDASNPQVKALQGTKLIEMGAQVLGTALPELAGPLQQLVQQIQTLVPQMMSQQMNGAPSPSPVPQMGAGAPQGPPM